MATPTLNELIASAISGAEEANEISVDPEVTPEAPVEAAAPVVGDVEKIASALEFVGRKGIETFIKEAAYGGGSAPECNDASVPGEQEVYSKGSDHNAALASNEAAIKYDKTEKAKLESPALAAVLDEKPFADPGLKKALSNASGKGDKNIHSKAAHAKLVKEALAAKVAEAQGDLS
tara:strand:- start:772 stop:1302 length:531 start_codon:yes stop_codon:yes gene_type:complete